MPAVGFLHFEQPIHKKEEMDWFWWLCCVSLLSFFAYIVAYIFLAYSQSGPLTDSDRAARRMPLKHVTQPRSDMSDDHLWTPFTIPGTTCTLRNRVVKAATYESMGSRDNSGTVTKSLCAFHSEQAMHVGMTIVSYGCVSVEGRTFPNQLQITSTPQHIAGLKALARHVHNAREGNKIAMQLTHAGIMAEPMQLPGSDKV